MLLIDAPLLVSLFLTLAVLTGGIMVGMAIWTICIPELKDEPALSFVLAVGGGFLVLAGADVVWASMWGIPSPFMEYPLVLSVPVAVIIGSSLEGGLTLALRFGLTGKTEHLMVFREG